jgi:dUTP pyrophosphatase
MHDITLRVRKLNPAAHLPKRANPGDSGLDLTYVGQKPIVIWAGMRALVPTGIALEVPRGWEIQIRPRSGLALKHGITVLNTPGTIDSGYRGEVGVILINTSQETVTIKPGDKIAQAVPAWVPAVEVEEVEELSDSVRGAGGFGSTG